MNTLFQIIKHLFFPDNPVEYYVFVSGYTAKLDGTPLCEHSDFFWVEASYEEEALFKAKERWRRLYPSYVISKCEIQYKD